MGCLTKVQLIKRKESEQWYINFPAAIAQAMEFQRGEVADWIIGDWSAAYPLFEKDRFDAHDCMEMYGESLPTPEALRQDDTLAWQQVHAYAAGERHVFDVKDTVRVCAKPSGPGAIFVTRSKSLEA